MTIQPTKVTRLRRGRQTTGVWSTERIHVFDPRQLRVLSSIDRPPTMKCSSHALDSSSANVNVRSALPLRQRGTVFPSIYTGTFKINCKTFYSSNFIQFPIEL